MNAQLSAVPARRTHRSPVAPPGPAVLPEPPAPPVRGFVLHVDLGPEAFAASVEDVMVTADTLRELVHEWLPQARTRTAVTAAAAGPPPAAPPSAAHLRSTLAALPDVPAVVVDLRAREVRVDGRALGLTSTEFELLAYLVRAQGRVVGRGELHRTVWRDRALPAESRTVDAHVRRLRAVPELTGLVATVHGRGYRVPPRPHVTVRE